MIHFPEATAFRVCQDALHPRVERFCEATPYRQIWQLNGFSRDMWKRTSVIYTFLLQVVPSITVRPAPRSGRRTGPDVCVWQVTGRVCTVRTGRIPIANSDFSMLSCIQCIVADFSVYYLSFELFTRTNLKCDFKWATACNRKPCCLMVGVQLRGIPGQLNNIFSAMGMILLVRTTICILWQLYLQHSIWCMM